MLPVPIRTAHEHDVLVLRLRLAGARAALASARKDAEPLERAFHAFDQRFTAAVGHLVAEISAVRGEHTTIAGYTKRLLTRVAIDPGHVLGDVFSDDELRHIGRIFDFDVPDEWFERRASSGADEFFEDAWHIPEPPRRPHVSPEHHAALKACYHRLARKWHPDHATSETERLVRQELMLQINAAWHARDLDALHAIEASAADALATLDVMSRTHLQTELEAAERQIAEARTRIRQLRASPTFPLWFDTALADAAIARRRRALQQTLEQERLARVSQLADLRAALQSYAMRL